MPTNDNTQGDQKDRSAIIPKSESALTQETAIPDKQMSDKFPKWDILPPHQFINPRVKKAE